MNDPRARADPDVVFADERPRLVALAYRMTGTPDDADDVVQEAWIRWSRADHDVIIEPAAWLTTATTRLAIDRLSSAAARRERYVGPWIPEPVLTADDPSEVVAAAESLQLGFLRVLETLQPVERAVFLLHDVFGMPFGEIAEAVGRTDAATRQLAKRARDRVRDGRPRIEPAPAEVEELSAAFVAALVDGDVDRLSALLTDDVIHVSDGGADHHAARRIVRGPDKVARLLINITHRNLSPTDEIHAVDVNGQRGLYIVRDGEPFSLNVLSWRGGRVAEDLAIVNPDKLRHFHTTWLATR